MSNAKFQRYKSLAEKYIRLQLRNLQPTALIGRLSGPKVLMNSIPKAGTNLLEQALGQFPYLHRSGFRTLRGWNCVDAATLKKIRTLEKGGVMLGHLPAHPELLAAINESGIKVLLMVRDPRDMIVSYVKYVTQIDLTHPAHPYFAALPDENARIIAAINGVDQIVSPAAETLEKFSGWLDFNRALVVRFEDIIGEKGGGCDIKQQETVRKIAAFLDIPITEDKLAGICEAIYSPTAITFRKPQIGGWRNVFNSEHIAAIQSGSGKLIQRYGYVD